MIVRVMHVLIKFVPIIYLYIINKHKKKNLRNNIDKIVNEIIGCDTTQIYK